MSIQARSLTDFSAGELSPKISGRYDSAFYNKGCMTLENWIPFTQGGITTRPGCKYLGATTGNAKARLIPFSVNKTTNYVLEFTNAAIYVWSAAGANLGAITGTSPYLLADLFEVQYAQVGPVLYLVHPLYTIRTLTWTTPNTFTLAALTIDYGYLVPAWAATHAYLVGDVVTNGTPTKIYKCVVAGTSAGATGPTTEANSITDNTVTWQFQSRKPFSQTSDYPSSIAYFAGRMWYAGTVNQPQRIWASEPFAYGGFNYADVFSYTTTKITANAPPTTWANELVPETVTVTSVKFVVTEGSAIEFEIASKELDSILWMVGAQSLVVGTTSSEWVIPPSVTALAVEATPRSGFGSAPVQPVTINDSPVFVQGTAAGLAYIRKYAYTSAVAELNSPNLSFTADHLFPSGIVQMDYAQLPQPTLFCVTGGGQIAALLFDEQYGVSAWYRYKLAQGMFESIAVIPGSGEDVIFATHIIGNLRYVVMFDAIWGTTNAPLDSWANVAAAGATETMARFVSMQVTAYNITDGTTFTATSTAGGVITIPAASQGDNLHIGLLITSTMQTQRITTDGPYGPGQMRQKRIGKVYARVIDSYPFKIGYVNTASLLETTVFPSASPYVGDVACTFNGNWTSDAWVMAIQDTPYRSTILGLIPEVEV